MEVKKGFIAIIIRKLDSLGSRYLAKCVWTKSAISPKIGKNITLKARYKQKSHKPSYEPIDKIFQLVRNSYNIH